MFLSPAGCFVLGRCFRLVTGGRDGPETKANVFGVGAVSLLSSRALQSDGAQG